jgi:hypothetical protein
MANNVYNMSTFGAGPDAAISQLNGQVGANGDQNAIGLGLSIGATSKWINGRCWCYSLGILVY